VTDCNNIRLRYEVLFVLGSDWSSVRTAVRQGAAAAGGDASGLGASRLWALLLALFPTKIILRLPV
jgi:hypothetical protein